VTVTIAEVEIVGRVPGKPGYTRPRDQVVMSLPERGLQLGHWTQYRFNSNFLTPTDGWSFTLAENLLSGSERRELRPGVRVTLSIDDHIQGDGYIDQVTISNARGSGTEITIEGRDRLAQAVDSSVDPRTKFTPNMTLSQFLAAVFKPFGWGDGRMQVNSNEENRNVLSGLRKGVPVNERGRRQPGAMAGGGRRRGGGRGGGRRRHKQPSAFQVHLLKPYPNEGAFAFAARVAQRAGLWIWLSADAEELIVSEPDFDQEPRYVLRRHVEDPEALNNVVSGTVSQDMTDQPTIIIADGASGGGGFGHSKVRRYMENPVIRCDHTEILKAYPDAVRVDPDTTFPDELKLTMKRPRPLFLHDEESKKPEMLDNYVRREMSLRMRKALECHYDVAGHSENGNIWAVDTMVEVDDEIGGVHEDLWILGRTFAKNRGSGTTTTLELIRPGTLEF